jgi:hypothetical protein
LLALLVMAERVSCSVQMDCFVSILMFPAQLRASIINFVNRVRTIPRNITFKTKKNPITRTQRSEGASQGKNVFATYDSIKSRLSKPKSPLWYLRDARPGVGPAEIRGNRFPHQIHHQHLLNSLLLWRFHSGLTLSVNYGSFANKTAESDRIPRFNRVFFPFIAYLSPLKMKH